MYDHFDEFKLILCRAEGTGYADFIEVLVDMEVDRSEEYYALLRKNGMLSGSMTRQPVSYTHLMCIRDRNGMTWRSTSLRQASYF